MPQGILNLLGQPQLPVECSYWGFQLLCYLPIPFSVQSLLNHTVGYSFGDLLIALHASLLFPLADNITGMFIMTLTASLMAPTCPFISFF